jgi:hypothetical protein
MSTHYLAHFQHSFEIDGPWRIQVYRWYMFNISVWSLFRHLRASRNSVQQRKRETCRRIFSASRAMMPPRRWHRGHPSGLGNQDGKKKNDYFLILAILPSSSLLMTIALSITSHPRIGEQLIVVGSKNVLGLTVGSMSGVRAHCGGVPTVSALNKPQSCQKSAVFVNWHPPCTCQQNRNQISFSTSPKGTGRPADPGSGLY